MEEEFCSDGKLLVAVNGDEKSEKICGIQRIGSSALQPDVVEEMLEVYIKNSTVKFDSLSCLKQYSFDFI